MAERDERGRFPPGNNANPAGRPKGSRNKLGEAFVEALFADFTEHGPQTIVAAREADPVAYLKVVAGLLPRNFQVKDDDLADLSDDQLAASIRHFVALLRTDGFDFGDNVPATSPDETTH